MASKQVVSRGHTRPLTEISFVRDGTRNLLISSAHDKSPMLRDGDTGDWIGTFRGHKGAVWSAKVDTRSRTLCATASGDFTAKLWCVSTGKELIELKHKHIVRTVDFSHDTERLATGCNDGVLRVFSVCDPESVPLELVGATKEPIIKATWLDETAHTVMLGRRSGMVEVYDVRTGGLCSQLQMPSDGASVQDLEISPARQTALVASGKQVYFITTGLQITQTFIMPDTMHFKEEGGVSLHPSGARFMAGASDLWLREFDCSTGEVLNTFKGHHGPIRCVRYHPSGNVIASGSEDGTIRLWEPQGGGVQAVGAAE